MLRYGLSYLLGLLLVLTGSGLPAFGTFLSILCLVTLLAALLRRNCVVVLLGFAGGMLSAWFAASNHLEDRLDPLLAGEILTVKGRIASLVDIEEGRQRFMFAPDDSSLPELISLSMYSLEPGLHAGERWQLTVKLREPRGFANPAGFDIEQWYFREGVGAVGYVRSSPSPRRLAAASGWTGWRERLLAAIHGRTSHFMHAGMLQALTAGDRRLLEESDWQLLRDTGTSHLVAISGLHLSLLAVVLAALVRWLSIGLFAGRLPNWLTLLLTEIGISAYAVLAGLDTPVQRAWVMVSLGLLAIGLARRFYWSAIYGLALSVVLMLDPLAPLDAGFWLSFVAVAAILFSVGGRIRQRSSWFMAIDIQWRLSLLLMPLGLAVFKLLAPASFIANLIAIPVTGFILLPLLLLALLCWPIAPLSNFLFWLADAGFESLMQILRWLADALPSRPLDIGLTLSLLLGGGIVMQLLPRALGMRQVARLALGVSCLLLWLPEDGGLQEGDWRMTALDVGQGTAVLIETRSHLMVYDTGPAFRTGSAAASVVVPVLLSRGQSPAMLMVSHKDSDHSGGLATLRLEFPDAEVLAGDDCAAGRAWQWDGVKFRILHPQPGANWSSNNGSCVLLVSGRHSVLLPGDIEAAAEASLVRSGLPPVDVLLAPHHGSRTSSTPEFVRQTAASLVLFPAGYANRWDFPRAEIRQRWENAGARTLTTGRQGAIDVTSSRRGLQTTCWRASTPRLWRYPAAGESGS